MIPYSNFLRYVLPYCPTAPEYAALDAIRDACIDFCDRSHWLHHRPADIAITPGVDTYEIDVPTETVAARVVAVAQASRQIKPLNLDEMATHFGGNWRGKAGNIQAYTQDIPGEIVIALTPAVAVDPLRVTVAIKPSRASTNVDDSIFERWAPVIGMGARALLHEQPNQPYTDGNSAMKYRALFKAGIDTAKLERSRGLTQSVQVLRPPRFI